MELFLISIIGCLIIGFLFYIDSRNKKHEQKEQEYINKIKEQEDFIQKAKEDKIELLDNNVAVLKQKLKNLVDEIYEKQRFNKELIKLRQEELDEIIKKERVEKQKSLENEMIVFRQSQLAQINAEVSANQILFERKREELANILSVEKEKCEAEISKIKLQLEDFRIRRESVNQAILREKEIQEQQDFYRIVVTEKEQADIQVLQDIIPRLNNREAISKLIWELYIRRSVQEMIKRITNGRKICGIYKITYLKTGEAYIGKTTDVQTRWNNHLKTVCGLEGAAHSTLHTHMERNGLWNYTFEILEEVDKDKLSEREAYYIDFYDTKHYGLNMRKG